MKMRYLLVALAMLLAMPLTAQQSHRVEEYVNNINPKQRAYLSSTGIIIVGKAPKARAFSRFNGTTEMARYSIDCGNYYRTTLPQEVNVYLLLIPSAASYYTPDVAQRWIRSEASVMNAVYAGLDPKVKIVDAYSALAKHVEEDIYSRTDHHWAPLGGYYTAEVLAREAGLPFRDLSNYERVVVPNYVGSMYSFSKDESIRLSPETFVYHKPRDIEYETTYISYSLASNRRTIVGESRPTKGEYFFNYKGSMAYCNFMSRDNRVTQVRTATKNGRRMLIIKDSFGNAIPGYLFYSFEEIHVVDFRFCNKNLKRYVETHGITDVVISTNISFACSANVMAKYKRLLTL